MSKYEHIRTYIYNVLNDFVASDGIKVNIDRDIELDTLTVSLGDADQEPLKIGEGFEGYGIKGEMEVFAYFKFKVSTGLNPDTLMYEWIDKIEDKIHSIGQKFVNETDYNLSILRYDVTNIRPRYEQDGDNYLILEIKANYEQVRS